MENFKGRYLGIDLGANSIGWAAIDINEGDVAMGVRVYEAALAEVEKDGVGKSVCAERREKRGQRRIIERRARRQRKLASILQRAGLLPPEVNIKDAIARDQMFARLDKELGSPYKLRAKALDEKLQFFELGRVFYHLCQRRGFLSNRKEGIDEEEIKTRDKKNAKEKNNDTNEKAKELGKVKKGISELQEKMQATNARTLGEYFASIEGKERIRERYTSRQMYEDEFRQIWAKQAEFYPEILTKKLKRKIHRTIFFQRPLKTPKKYIGSCELEPKRRRYPWAYLEAQRLRYLQKINDLEIINNKTGEIRSLTPEERRALIRECENHSAVSFANIRTLLNLPKNTEFNLEKGGEKNIPGNKTTAKLRPIFGEKLWDSMSDEQKNAVVTEWRSVREDKTLEKRAKKLWFHSDENASDDEKESNKEKARKLSKVALESGYCRFSLVALKKILPELQRDPIEPKDNRLQAIIANIYDRKTTNIHELLPPVVQVFPHLTNPAVIRSLTQLRLVVNAYIKKYGKPDFINIELARQVKQTAKQRLETIQKNRRLQRKRENAKSRLQEECKIGEPSNEDILKVLLADECNWQCPYSGRTINIFDLVGSHPQYQIEHIIPYDRCLDDSYANKTICHRDENVFKGNRTPYEAYHDTDKWPEIMARVAKFQGEKEIVEAKRRRFLATPQVVEQMLNGFVNRQLNDTAYAAKLARQYLGLLYGGESDKGIGEDRKVRVRAVAGQATAKLRAAWSLNTILGGNDANPLEKSRQDHRHHAIDALVVALTTPAIIKRLADSARKANRIGRRGFADFSEPWPNFHDRVKQEVDKIIVSHMVRRKVSGALHQETFYSVVVDEKGKPKKVFTRKAVKDLTDAEKKRIEDTNILQILDGKNPMAKKVKIPAYFENVSPVGKPPFLRWVTTDSIHHMEIYEEKTKKGIKWDAEVVSLFDAYRRQREKKPVINKDYGEGKRFLFSLSCGDTIELDNPKTKKRELYVVRSTPQSKQIEFFPINVAMKKTEYQRLFTKAGLTAKMSGLQKLHCRKVEVSPLGEIRYADNLEAQPNDALVN